MTLGHSKAYPRARSGTQSRPEPLFVDQMFRIEIEQCLERWRAGFSGASVGMDLV